MGASSLSTGCVELHTKTTKGLSLLRRKIGSEHPGRAVRPSMETLFGQKTPLIFVPYSELNSDRCCCPGRI
jgi:hypothetical protein